MKKIITYIPGSQTWFSQKQSDRHDKTISKYGCGLIALADLMQYLTGTSRSREDYMAYVRSLDHGAMRIIPPFGISCFGLWIGLHRECRKEKISCRVRWGVATDHLERTICWMIEQGMPVILSINRNLNPIHPKDGVTLYERRQNELVPSQKCRGHFVTVTGYGRSGGELLLYIASWGKPYCIKFEEYRAYIRRQPPIFGTIGSNILLIKRSMRKTGNS